MSEHKETLAEIVAEMRKRMKSYYYSREGRNLMRQYADRIEAAWKRQEQCYLDQIRDAVNQWGHEKYKAEHAPVGNSAAMREALEMFCGYSATVLNTGMFNRVHLEALLNKAKAALAKPSRNCDMYQDGQSAYNGWRDSFRDKRSPELLFSDWIFETAKEKTDGIK